MLGAQRRVPGACRRAARSALARQQLEFVATVSHELRTPLAVIRSAADNLADGVVNDEARIRQYGQLVRREGLRLTDLVEQILEFAGLQSGQRTMARRRWRWRRCCATSRRRPRRRRPAGIDHRARRSPTTCRPWRATKRRCAACSRTSSATRSSTAPTRAGSASRAAVTRPRRVEVSVSDRGIGIAAADQAAHLRSVLPRARRRRRADPGRRPRPSLVKRIVEAHGGPDHAEERARRRAAPSP